MKKTNQFKALLLASSILTGVFAFAGCNDRSVDGNALYSAAHIGEENMNYLAILKQDSSNNPSTIKIHAIKDYKEAQLDSLKYSVPYPVFITATLKCSKLTNSSIQNSLLTNKDKIVSVYTIANHSLERNFIDLAYVTVVDWQKVEKASGHHILPDITDYELEYINKNLSLYTKRIDNLSSANSKILDVQYAKTLENLEHKYNDKYNFSYCAECFPEQ